MPLNFINANASQRLNPYSNNRVDSTNVCKKIIKDVDIFTQAKMHKASNSTKPANSGTAAAPVKPKPAPPPKLELGATASNSQNECGTLVGSFNTNLPTFNSLNMQNKKAVADAGGVGVYGSGDVNVTHIDGNPPMERVVFPGSNVSVEFPTQQQPVQGSIVFDEETKTYAFNNLEGVRITSRPHTEGEGGENFLVSGGTVDYVNLAENSKEGSKLQPNFDTKPQTLVLMNTTVKDGAINVANDRIIANKNTQMDTDAINVLAKKADGSQLYHSSYLAYEGHQDGKSTSKLQTGYTVSSAYTNWLGGSESDLKNLKTSETLGTVHVDHESFNAINSIKDKAPARTIGNVNIYTTSGDGNDVRVIEDSNGQMSLVFANKNTRFTLPKDQAEGSQIYYDKDSNTLYMQNLTGVSGNKDKSSGHYDMDINLVIKDTHFTYLNTLETTDSAASSIASPRTGSKTQSNIAILGKSTVDQLYSSIDNIDMGDEASVGTYAGIGNETTENLQNQNAVVRENRAWVKQDPNAQIYYKVDNLNGLHKSVRNAFSNTQTYHRK